ncbi:MAG: HPr(Ser) kinase/phosphatase [Chlamydiia bacterium]|nr:HPr(Ser) kinase/phosphatase [Chlamydiia bacterium]
MYSVKDLFSQHGNSLGLELMDGGGEGLKREIALPEAHRPGLALAGYMKGHDPKRVLILGKVELEYLGQLNSSLLTDRLSAILEDVTPAIIVARGLPIPKELSILCKKRQLPLFRTHHSTMQLFSRLTLLLNEEFAPTQCLHGTFVEIHGIGVLIQGDSSVGKSEAALGLLKREHRLISDDIVKVKIRSGEHLVGFGVETTRHHMEIRGIGIINVADLFGAVCIKEKKSLDIVVKLEVWDDTHYYDRMGLSRKTIDILNIPVPYHILPVKPGRDVVLLLETIALNHRLKKMKFHSAKKFKEKLREAISQKSKIK